MILVAPGAAVITALGTGLLGNNLSAQARGTEALLPGRGAERRHREPASGERIPCSTTVCRTVDQVRTRYVGIEAPRIPRRSPIHASWALSRASRKTALKTMGAGYAFAKNFGEERVNAYKLDDQRTCDRRSVSRGTCMHCHAAI